VVDTRSSHKWVRIQIRAWERAASCCSAVFTSEPTAFTLYQKISLERSKCLLGPNPKPRRLPDSTGSHSRRAPFQARTYDDGSFCCACSFGLPGTGCAGVLQLIGERAACSEEHAASALCRHGHLPGSQTFCTIFSLTAASSPCNRPFCVSPCRGFRSRPATTGPWASQRRAGLPGAPHSCAEARASRRSGSCGGPRLRPPGARTAAATPAAARWPPPWPPAPTMRPQCPPPPRCCHCRRRLAR